MYGESEEIFTGMSIIPLFLFSVVLSKLYCIETEKFPFIDLSPGSFVPHFIVAMNFYRGVHLYVVIFNYVKRYLTYTALHIRTVHWALGI